MTTARYFQDELEYLRKSGDEFARYFPKLSNYLSSQSVDPDVERLMEGFAFLTGRLREKIDDQLPEVTQSLLMLLWPNFLRSVPSMTIMQFPPITGAITEQHTIPKGASLESVPVDETICRFQTCYDVNIHPIRVSEVKHDISREASVVTISINTLSDEDITTVGLKNLRFYLGESDYSALTTNLWLHRYLKKASVQNKDGDDIDIHSNQIRQAGLDKAETVLPYPDNAFTGYRLIQEFYSLPQKYYFMDLQDLPLSHVVAGDTGFDIVLEFERPLPPDVRVRKNSFMLHCVPAINLFSHDAEPILMEGKRVEYKVEPARLNGSELDIYSIEEVYGWIPDPNTKSGGISREYPRFESFHHEIERAESRSAIYFREKVKQPISGEGLDRYLSFILEDEVGQINKGETISVELLCSNGVSPTELGIGDINTPLHSVPAFVKIQNITRPTNPRCPTVDGSLQWQLISALSLNYLSLQNAEALRTILHSYDFASRVDRKNERTALRRLEGLESIQSETVDRLFKGLPVRGTRSTIQMRESHFASEGEMFLFSTVLAEFFALFSTLNSFHELVVHGLEAGEEYRWTARIGNQPLI